jgi:hypothetical protein
LLLERRARGRFDPYAAHSSNLSNGSDERRFLVLKVVVVDTQTKGRGGGSSSGVKKGRCRLKSTMAVQKGNLDAHGERNEWNVNGNIIGGKSIEFVALTSISNKQ